MVSSWRLKEVLRSRDARTWRGVPHRSRDEWRGSSQQEIAGLFLLWAFKTPRGERQPYQACLFCADANVHRADV